MLRVVTSTYNLLDQFASQAVAIEKDKAISLLAYSEALSELKLEIVGGLNDKAAIKNRLNVIRQSYRRYRDAD